MKRICVTIKSLANGGAEKQSLLLARSLQEKYETHLVIISNQPKLQKHLDFIHREKISYIFLTGNLLQKLLAFRSFLREKEIDIIFSFLPGDTLFGAIAGKLEGISYICGGIRNSTMEKHKLFSLKYLHNYILNYSISNCYSGAEQCVTQGFKKEKILVIPNGIELHPCLVKKFTSNKLNITTIGRFVEQKDYHTAIKSINFLIKNYKFSSPITYRIIGYGEQEQQLRNWIKDYQIEDITELIINPASVAKLLEESDIYLCTSLFEGLSNAIMEAMSYRIPIVATRVGDNTRLVQNNVNGYLTEPKDYQTIAARLYELIESYDKRIELGNTSYDIIQQNYSFDRFKMDYFKLIETLN